MSGFPLKSRMFFLGTRLLPPRAGMMQIGFVDAIFEDISDISNLLFEFSYLVTSSYCQSVQQMPRAEVI